MNGITELRRSIKKIKRPLVANPKFPLGAYTINLFTTTILHCSKLDHGALSTIGLLIKVACFFRKLNNIFFTKTS